MASAACRSRRSPSSSLRRNLYSRLRGWRDGGNAVSAKLAPSLGWRSGARALHRAISQPGRYLPASSPRAYQPSESQKHLTTRRNATVRCATVCVSPFLDQGVWASGARPLGSPDRGVAAVLELRPRPAGKPCAPARGHVVLSGLRDDLAQPVRERESCTRRCTLRSFLDLVRQSDAEAFGEEADGDRIRTHRWTTICLPRTEGGSTDPPKPRSKTSSVQLPIVSARKARDRRSRWTDLLAAPIQLHAPAYKLRLSGRQQLVTLPTTLR